MRHSAFAILLPVGFGALLSACSDAPTVIPAADAEGPALLMGTTAAPNDGRITFVVSPSREATYNIGAHKIVFPAHSICDPSTSGYGMAEWDKPCEPLRGAITITADTSTVDGHPYINFSPELRFVPTTNPEKSVVLFVSDPALTQHTATGFSILYHAPDGSLVDEALADPTAATRLKVNASGKVVLYRRLKHFSGYFVAARTASTAEAQ